MQTAVVLLLDLDYCNRKHIYLNVIKHVVDDGQSKSSLFLLANLASRRSLGINTDLL